MISSLNAADFKYLKCQLLCCIIRCYLDVQLLTDTFSGLKYCPTLLETFGLRVPVDILENLAYLVLTLNIETFLPFEARRRRRPSTVIPLYLMDVRTGLIWLTGWCFILLLHNFINWLNL